jgi:hypothetical protein
LQRLSNQQDRTIISQFYIMDISITIDGNYAFDSFDESKIFH